MRDAFEEKREIQKRKKERTEKKTTRERRKKIQISLSRERLSSFALDDTE